jgi:hypothetical protein
LNFKTFIEKFKPKSKEQRELELRKGDFSEKGLKNALDKAFQRMQESGVDRVVLSAVPLPANEPSSGEKHPGNYYPAESLTSVERPYIKESEHKPYQVVALLADGAEKLSGNSIEVVDRVPFFVFSLVEPHRFSKARTVFNGEQEIDAFVKIASVQKGISAGATLAAVEPQIAEYKQITTRLFEKSGVYEAVEKLAAREFANETDKFLFSIREAIASAKKD